MFYRPAAYYDYALMGGASAQQRTGLQAWVACISCITLAGKSGPVPGVSEGCHGLQHALASNNFPEHATKAVDIHCVCDSRLSIAVTQQIIHCVLVRAKELWSHVLKSPTPDCGRVALFQNLKLHVFSGQNQEPLCSIAFM